MYNNQYPSFPYNNKRKRKDTYLTRISKQLMVVLLILLVLLLMKYVKNERMDTINQRVRLIFYSDYTNDTVSVFKNKLSGSDNILQNVFNNFKKNNEFKLDFLPVDGNIITSYGTSINPTTKKQEQHKGIDISAKEKTEVKCVFDGIVEKIEDNQALGLTLLIDHKNGYKSLYGHLSEINVNEGENVSIGDVVAVTGKTSDSKTPHLYFEILKDGNQVNPISYLKSSEN